MKDGFTSEVVDRMSEVCMALIDCKLRLDTENSWSKVIIS